MTDARTRELLGSLHAEGHGRRAWIHFLSRSLAQAREDRGAHPRAHRQTLALGAAGLAAWTAVAATGRPALGAAGATWWLLVVLMAEWHLGLLGPRDGLGVPNTLSLLRGGTPPALLALGASAGNVVLAAAGATDVLDGVLARRGHETRLGFWLDPAVDGFVLTAAALAVFPWWAAVLVGARFALPWLAIAAVAFARAETPSTDDHVRGRLPGLVLFAGLALAYLGSDAGAVIGALGSLGALATFAVSLDRAVRPAPAD